MTRHQWDALHILTSGPMTAGDLAQDLGLPLQRTMDVIGLLADSLLIRRCGPGVVATMGGHDHLGSNPTAKRVAPETLTAHLAKPTTDPRIDEVAEHFGVPVETITRRLAEVRAMETA
jgi:hypothetical protein